MRVASLMVLLMMVALASLAGAQQPGDKTVIQRPSLAVYLGVFSGRQTSELELRIRTKPLTRKPPEVEFQDTAGGTPRPVEIHSDEQGTAWLGAITNVAAFGVGHVHVMATTDSGLVERHELRFATRGTVRNQPNVVYSSEGQFGLVILPGGVPAGTRFLVTTLELPDPPLPAGVTLEAGPFQITATQPIPDQVKASVAIRLAERSPNDSPSGYQVRWLNPAQGVWEVLPADINSKSGSPLAQAAVSRLGMFVLTSEVK
jgi:hypothetical protein